MKDILTQSELVTWLRKRAALYSQKELAESLGLSESYLSDVLRGQRPPAGKLLAAIGYQAETRYVRVKGRGSKR